MRLVLPLSVLMLAVGCRATKGPTRIGDPSTGAGLLARGGKQTRVEMTLPNGLKVVLEENHLAPVIAMQAWVGVGSADDPPAMEGIAHLFEHMLFKSTRKRGVGQVAREVAAAGGEINAWTSFDETVYHLVLASPYLDMGLDILADALTSATFDAGELARERALVLGEIRQAQESPERAASQLLFRASFTAHPYGRPVLGTAATVGALTRDQLLAAYQRSYVAGNVTLVIVGDFDGAAARDKIKVVFSGMRPGGQRPARPPEPVQSAPRSVVATRDLPETQLLLSFHTPAITHEDVPALDLLAVILGQGEGARLERQVTRSRQLVSSATAYTFASRDGGLLVVSASTAPGRLEDPARAILDEVLRLGREEVSPAELARARTVIESGAVRDKDTLRGYARKLGLYACVAGDPDFELRYLGHVAATTPAELRDVAARYLRVGNLTGAALVSGRSVSGARGGVDVTRLTARLDGVWAAAEGRMARRYAPIAVAADDVVRVVLPSGVRVLVLHDPTLRVVDVHAIWAGGLRNEDAHSNGISGLLATMLPLGTKSRTPPQMKQELDEIPGTLAGFSARDSLGLRAEFLADQWERGLDLVADCILNPRFAEEDLERERRVALDQIRAAERNPVRLAFRLFWSSLWSKHPYRLDELGTVESVASLSRRRLVDHYRRFYGVSGLTIAVVGDVDAARVVTRIQALLADAPAVAAAGATPAVELPRVEPAEVFRQLQDDSAHVVVGYLGVTLRDPDRFPLQVLAEILSRSQGRVEAAPGQPRAEPRPSIYRTTATSVEGIDPGYFAIYLACSPPDLDAAVRATRAELAWLVDHGVTADELARARQYLVGTHAVQLERRSAVAAALASHEAYGQGWREYRRDADNIQKVSLTDVQRVARRIFDPRREVVAALRPAEDASTVARRAASEIRSDVATTPSLTKTGGAARSSAP